MTKTLSYKGDDLIKLYLTENTVNENTKITITKIDSDDIFGLEGRDKFASDAFEIRPNGQKLSYPVQLTLKYDVNNIATLKGSEDRLAIYTFHEASNQWYELPSTVCTSSKTVSTNINHFSVYTLKMRPENSDISVKIYTYKPSNSEKFHEVEKNHVIFKYSDLINRAIKFKQEFPKESVVLKFVLYEFEKYIYLCFKRTHAKYGCWYNHDFANGASEKLIYSLIKAANAGVEVWLLYHNPEDHDDPPDDELGEYINEYLNDNAIFHYRKNRVLGNDSWAKSKISSKLQHNKFMIINHYLGDSKDSIYDYNVYVTTANANGFNAVNSGILIRGNVDLYDAYNRYFMKLYAFYDNHTNFKCSVRGICDENIIPTNPEDVHYPEYNHADNTLNYIEEDNDSKITFQAYFYPIPKKITESWDTTFNPVAKVVEKMISRPKQKKYIKINAYHWNGNNDSQFGYRLYHKIRYSLDSSKNHIMYVINKDSSSDDIGDEVIKRKINDWKDDSDRTAEFYYKFDKKTHAKNFQFAFSTLDSNADKEIYKREYYVITGSVNPKRYAYTERGNNQIVIREPFTDHPIYDAYKDCFNDAYDLDLE